MTERRAEGADLTTRVWVRRFKVNGKLVDEDWRELSPEEIEAGRQAMLAEMHEQTERFSAWVEADLARLRQEVEVITEWKRPHGR